ncbi:MAG: NAD(P)-dependent oxidoreductase [Vicinamibacterales bacterium]
MLKPRLAILNPTCLDVVEEHRAWIEAAGVELLADQSNRDLSASAVTELLRDADAVILPAQVRNAPLDEQMIAATRLLVCSIAASGYEWLDVAAATRNGIVVAFSPGREGAEVVADMAWGLMLAVARQIPFHHQRLRVGDARRGMGTSVFGKKLGIIGLGNIGKCVARRAAGFDVQILAAEPRPDEAFVREHHIRVLSRDKLLAESDFISLHVRLDESTRNLIGADEFKRMKQSAILINTARRELVSEEALTTAIESGQIAGAGLDDPPGPVAARLLDRRNVVFTPHIGNRAIEGVHGVFRMAVENCLAVFRHERPPFLVNAEVYESGVRVDRRQALERIP